MSISLSVFYPDLSLKESQFYEAATRIAMSLATFSREDVQTSKPEIDVHFLLSGKFDSPSFTGMRIRNFDSKLAILRVETAVPPHIVNSDKAAAYIAAAIADAIENASEFLKEIEMPFDADAHFELSKKLETTPVTQQLTTS